MDGKDVENEDKSSSEEESDRSSESEESYYNPYRAEVLVETFVFLSAENVVWKLVICASCFIIHIVQLYDMFFWNYLKIERIWKITRWLCDFIYLIDVASAIVHRKFKNIRVRSDEKPRKIIFIAVDVVSLIPIDFMCGISERAFTDELYMITFLQRSLRIYRIVIYLREMNNTVAIRDAVVLCHKYVMLIFIAMHTLACFWHYLATQGTRTWFTDLEKIDFYPGSPFQRYLICTYYISSAITGVGVCQWTLLIISMMLSHLLNKPVMKHAAVCRTFSILSTLSATDSKLMSNILGDIAAVNNVERYLTIVTMATGQIIIVGLFVGSWSTVLEEINRPFFEFRYRVGLMNHEMKSRAVPEKLKKRVLAFYGSFWKRCHAVVNSALFQRLPLAMIREVNLDIYWKATNSVSLLQDLDISEKREISCVMTTQHFMPGDFVSHEGDLKHSLLYLAEGIVQVFVKGIDCPAISLAAGSCIGGSVGLLLGGRRVTSLRALTCCKLHVISRADFFRVASKFPRIAQKIRRKFQRELRLIRNKAIRSAKMTSRRERSIGEEETDIGSDISLEKLWETNRDVEAAHFLGTSIMEFPPRHKLNCYTLVKVTKQEPDPAFVSTGMPFILQPQSWFLDVWSRVVFVTVLAVAFIYPFYISVAGGIPQSVKPFTMFVNVIYFLDLFLLFLTATHDGKGFAKTFSEIATVKISESGFILDIIATVPLELFVRAVFAGRNQRLEDLAMLNRVIKIKEVIRQLQKMEKVFDANVTVLRLFKYLILLFFGSLWLGASLYMIACGEESCNFNSWIALILYEDVVVGSLRAPETYIFYEPMSSASKIISMTGSDISAGNMREVIVLQFSFIAGTVLFTYLVSDYSALLRLIRYARLQFEEMILVMKNFLTYNNISPDIQYQIVNHLNVQWENRKGYYLMTNVSLFHDLPVELQDELKAFGMIELIRKVPLFKGLPQKTLLQVCRISSVRVLPPQTVVVYAGEVFRKMYIVQRGYCHIYSGATGELNDVVSPGGRFYILEMMLGICGVHTVVTDTHCTVIVISFAKFMKVLATHPEYRKDLRKIIENMHARVKTMHEFHVERHVKPKCKERKAHLHSFSKYSDDVEVEQQKMGTQSVVRLILLSKTIMPYGRFIHIWEGIRVACAVMSGFYFPLKTIMGILYPQSFYFALVLDIMAYLDLYVRLHVCFYNDNGLLISHAHCTAKHYLSHGFFLDVLGCVPIQYISPMIVMTPDGKERYNLLVQTVLSFNRMIQLHRMPAAMKYQDSAALRYFKYVSVILILLNALSAILTTIAIEINVSSETNYQTYTIVHTSNTWVTRTNDSLPFMNDGIMYVHFTAIYYIATVASSLGTGDIACRRNDELAFFIVLVFLGYLLFNYVFAIIASHYMESHVCLTQQRSSLARFVEFLRKETVPRETISEVVEHFELQWFKTQGMQIDVLVTQLNVRLKETTLADMYYSTLEKVPIFIGVDRTFLHRLCSIVSEKCFVPGATILQANDITSYIFIIHRGFVDIVGAADTKLCALGAGSVFGNLEQCTGIRSLITVLATSEVDVLVVRTEAFYDLAHYHPVVANRINNLIIQNLCYAGRPGENSDRYANRKDIYFKTHGSIGKFLYEVTTIIAAYCSIIIVTYHAGFQNHSVTVLVLTYMIDVYFFLYTIIDYKINTRKYKKKHLKWYMKWLHISELLQLPLGLTLFLALSDKMFILSLLRLTRLLRIHHIFTYFSVHTVRLNVNITLLQWANILIALSLCIHLFCCAWYMVGCFKGVCHKDSWYAQVEESLSCTPYICSVYYVISVLAFAGYGDIVGKTLPEITFCLILIIFSVFATGVYIGKMHMLVEVRDTMHTTYEGEISILKKYLIAENTSDALIRKVLGYACKLWPKEGGHAQPELLDKLPEYLSSRVRSAAFGKYVYQSQIFAQCHPDFLRQLLLHIRRNVYYEGNYIALDGDVDSNMYFVHYGKVNAIRMEISKPIVHQVLQEGDIFGMIQGLFPDMPHTYTYRASSHAIILSLNFHNWKHLLRYFLASKQKIYKTASIIQERQKLEAD